MLGIRPNNKIVVRTSSPPEEVRDIRCIANVASSGRRCVRKVITGTDYCEVHGGKDIERYKSEHKPTRVKRLANRLGKRFESVLDEVDSLEQDFQTDNQLIKLYEDELIERLKLGDSPGFRKTLIKLYAALYEEVSVINSYVESGHSIDARHIKSLSVKAELLNKYISDFKEHDSVWETLLNNIERRSRTASRALEVLTKRENAFTMRDLTLLFGKLFDIIARKVGPSAAEGIKDDVERELFSTSANSERFVEASYTVESLSK